MKKKADGNRTLTCSKAELNRLAKNFLRLDAPACVKDIGGKIINQDICECAVFLPDSFVDLLILDPPYNLTKNYNGRLFRSRKASDYVSWFDEIINSLEHTLKPDATIYVCSEWRTSAIIFPILERHFRVRNRITWEREKGRGTRSNWKNNTEDIWFCTAGKDYYFNVDAVKVKRRVIAPYKTGDGKPKDWDESADGNFRLTHPSNIWADITVPFWSMRENTDHPTQKPEKLMAKLVLASSKPNDFVFDPFLGSGTTTVTARKLNRRFSGVEINTEYCCWAEKRLSEAASDKRIQGYTDGVFWERNSLRVQGRKDNALW